MSVPDDRKYLETHEWHLLEGQTVTIGITQHAADELTDVTFVELPPVGKELQANSPFGQIESVKTTADLMSGVSGSVLQVNEELVSNPGLVNSDPFGRGWIIKVRISDPREFDQLLTAEQYRKRIGQ